MKRTVFGMLLLVGLSAVVFAQERNGVTITLLSDVVLDDSVIYLDQIAKLSGGPPSLRQRLARLDIAEFRLGLQRTAVTSDQVKFRLMLAGIPVSQFQLSGAARVIVGEGSDPITSRKIRAVAERAMFSRHPSAGPSREIIAPLLDVRRGDRVELDADVINTTRVEVAIVINGKMRETLHVPFDSNTKTTSGMSPPPPPPQPRPELQKEKNEILIKSRDLVKIVAVVGPAQLVASGEAQQDGKLGEIIRVRNTESNRNISGRVESAGVVIVEY